MEEDTTSDTNTTSIELPADWGGDGSDSLQPVRAHIEAALVPTSQPYLPPLDELLRLGDLDDENVDQRRAALGIGQEHVPELARMARDRALYISSMESPEVWAPGHALELLKTLDSSQVIANLVPLLDLEDDWYDTLLPEVFGSTGLAALEPLLTYVGDATRWVFGRAIATAALSKLAEQHPEARGAVVAGLVAQLNDEQTSKETGGAIVSSLVDVKATEALPDIRRAFERDGVDESVHGGWGDVQEVLGVTPDPTDPLVIETQRRWKERKATMYPWAIRNQTMPASQPLLAGKATSAKSKPGEKARKQKNKRKQQTASRKANKRRGR